MAIRSDDGGVNWNEPTQVSSSARARVVAPSPAAGAKAGELNVLYLDLGDDVLDYGGGHKGRGGAPYDGNWQLVLARSTDNGGTWKESVVDDTITPTERFIVFTPPSPSIAVDPDSGRTYAAFHDARARRFGRVPVVAARGRRVDRARARQRHAEGRWDGAVPARAVDRAQRPPRRPVLRPPRGQDERPQRGLGAVVLRRRQDVPPAREAVRSRIELADRVRPGTRAARSRQPPRDALDGRGAPTASGRTPATAAARPRSRTWHAGSWRTTIHRGCPRRPRPRCASAASR